jgi:5,10-methenyltetrahydrofolate synthetase
MTKSDQREQIRLALAELTTGQRAEKSAQIREKAAEELENAASVMAFVPTRGEPDIAQLFAGRAAAYPCTGPDGTMEAVEPTAWTQGRFGIPEPAEGRTVPPEELDLVFVPLTAFDEKNRRLGRGGGYYDNYLKRCVRARKVGVAFAEQKLDEVVTDDYDVRLDAVLYA